MRIGLCAVLLAAVLLGLAGTDARAQSGERPPECDAAPAKTPSNSTALTAYPDVPLYLEAYGTETVGTPLPFRTRVIKLPAARKGDRIQVRTAEGSQCGYVERAKLLDGPPLKVSDIDPDDKVQAGLFGYVRNTWTVRAILRTNPNLDAKANEVTLVDAPDGRPFRTLRVVGAFSNLFNIFKIDKRGSGPEDWWYFVGGKKVADDKVLSGWVRGGNLFLWRNRVAVYSTADKSAPFDVYADLESLKKGTTEGLTATRVGLDPPPDRDVAKFPILDQIFAKAGDRKSGALPIAYEIGFFGQGCGAAGACDDAAKIGDRLSRIGEIVRSSGQIDVMLVIENTPGMTKYLAPIARAVSRWARETSLKPGRVRFGASIYGDYRERTRPAIDSMDFRLIAQLDGDATKLERALTGAGQPQPFGDAVGDLPEAGYAALVRTAREGWWAADAGYRLVVWIGSQGVQRDRAKLIDPVDVAQVQKELREKKLYLAAINVAGSRPEKSTFVEDASRILDRSKMALGVPPIRTLDGNKVPPEEPELAAQRVKDLLDVVLHYSKAVPEWIESQRDKEASGKAGGTVSPAPKAGGLPPTADVSGLKAGPLDRMALTPEGVESVLGVRQVMTRGYVSYDTQKKNLAFSFAMEPNRFSLLSGSLAELCRAMSEDDDLRNRLLGVMLTLAHNLGGDPYSPSETIAEYFDRLIFLPKLPVATWLDKSLTDLPIEWGMATPERRRQLHFSACRSAYLLQQMSLGQKVQSINDLELDAVLGKAQLKPGRSLRPFNWLWTSVSGVELYFVPAEHLPHG